MERRKKTNIEETFMAHISQEQDTLSAQAQDIQSIKYTLYGNPETGEKGMATKVNEMYDMLIVAKGGKTLLGMIVLLGAAVSALVIIKKYL